MRQTASASKSSSVLFGGMLMANLFLQGTFLSGKSMAILGGSLADPLKERGRRRGGKKHKDKLLEQGIAPASATKEHRKQKGKGNRTKLDRLLQIPLSIFLQVRAEAGPIDS